MCAAFIASLAVFGQLAQRIEIGDPAPPLQVQTWVKGSPVRAYEPGTTYLVEFWAVWCGPCLAGMPHLSAMQNRYEGKLRVIGLTSQDEYGNTLDAVKALVEKKGATIKYSVAWDEPTQEKYMGVFQGKTNQTLMRGLQLSSFPVAVVIDGKGRVALVGNPSEMDAALERIINGQWDLAAAKRNRAELLAAEAQIADIEKKIKDGDRRGAFATAQQVATTAAWGDARLMLWLSNQYAGDSIIPTVEELALALKCGLRAVNLTGRKDPGYLDNLAALLFKKGDIRAAVEIETEAVSKSEGPMKKAQEAQLKKYRSALSGGS